MADLLSLLQMTNCMDTSTDETLHPFSLYMCTNTYIYLCTCMSISLCMQYDPVSDQHGTCLKAQRGKRQIDDEHAAIQVADDEIYLVVNAGCREKDLAHINKYLEKVQVCLPSSITACSGLPHQYSTQFTEGCPLSALDRHAVGSGPDPHIWQCACCAVKMLLKCCMEGLCAARPAAP